MISTNTTEPSDLESSCSPVMWPLAHHMKPHQTAMSTKKAHHESQYHVSCTPDTRSSSLSLRSFS